MRLSSIARQRISAGFGSLAVLLGAFGAHSLQPTLIALGTSETWKTAALYHLTQSVVLLLLSGKSTIRLSFALFAAGILLFSGSLYLYAVTVFKPLVFLAPVGGVCLIAGWISLFFASRET